MSVLIKGMSEIPDHDAVYIVKHADDGKVYIRLLGVVGLSMELMQLPEQHGRLIDVDAFKSDYSMADECGDCKTKVRDCEYDRTYTKMDFCYWLDNAEVVIEAEKEE